MTTQKKQWILLQTAAMLLTMGLFLVLQPHLARAVGSQTADVPNNMDGSGSPVDPYVVTTCQNLQDISLNLNAYYVLGNNIDCSGSASWNGGAGFTPIGDQTNAFTGTLDGHQHTISQIYIDQSGNSSSTDDLAGIFGKVHQGKLLDFTVSQATVIANTTGGSGYTGGVAGNMHESIMANVNFQGTILRNGCSSQLIGGLVGYMSTSGSSIRNIINRSTSVATIAFSSLGCNYQGAAGGLVGQAGDISINDSYAKTVFTIDGEATSTCTTNDCRIIGGLIGTKDIDGNGDIQSSYSSGSVSIINDNSPYLSYQVGGIAGSLSADLSVHDSFSTLDLSDIPATCNNVSCGSDTRSIGGLYGVTNGNSGDWSNYWFDQHAANGAYCTNSNASDDGRCNYVNTDGSQPHYFESNSSVAPLDSWNFTTYWYVSSGDLPALANRDGSPLAPSVSLSIDSATSLAASWSSTTPSSAIDHYELYVRPTGTTSWTLYDGAIDAAATSEVISGLATNTQYDVTILAYGKNYYYSNPSTTATGSTATPGFVLISSCTDLQNIQNDLTKNYELAHNIDCSDTVNWNGGAGFLPLGNFDLQTIPDPFTGIFKGNNYAINDLYINTSLNSVMNGGLFGCTAGNALIQDVTLNNPTVTGYYVAGTVASFDFESTITNVHVIGGTINGSGAAIGGLVGFSTKNEAGYTHISKSEFNGDISTSGVGTYIGGLVGGDSGYVTISNSFANATMTMPRSQTAGGLVGFTGNPNTLADHITNSYAAGSLSMTDPDPYNNPDPNALPLSAAGSFLGGSLNSIDGPPVITNSFGSVSITSVTPDQAIGGFIGFALTLDSNPGTGDLSTDYFDADMAGVTTCASNEAGNCNAISGQPSYFKNNSTNPPLSQWDFTNIWQVTSAYPTFTAAVTTSPTTIPPERLNPQPTPNPSGGDSTTTSPAAPVTLSAQSQNATFTGSSKATAPDDEQGILGALKHFVRNLPAAVVIAFPYAIFGFLLLAVLLLAVELWREIRRYHVVAALIRKQRLLAEERDAFWHLAANYLRAPITLIVGGAESLHESHDGPTPVTISLVAASLQTKVASIMKQIEDSSSLRSIRSLPAGIRPYRYKWAYFITPVTIAALLVAFGDYATVSWRNLDPGFSGYAIQIAIFTIAAVLLYWTIDLLSRGKSRRQAAEQIHEQQTAELNNARHQLIADTSQTLNPDLTRLEELIGKLPTDTATTAPGALQTLHEGTDRLRNIVTSFTLLTQIQESTGAVQAMPPQAIDLSAIMRSVRTKLTPEISAKGLRVTAPSVPLPVAANTELAQQVIESIVSNAVDYSPANSTVKVEAKKGDDTIQLRITDQGQGISQDQLSHLFQPFTHADNSSAMDMSHGGFGINLYLDKLIMEKLGGTISASSEAGHGTSITLEWPTA